MSCKLTYMRIDAKITAPREIINANYAVLKYLSILKNADKNHFKTAVQKIKCSTLFFQHQAHEKIYPKYCR